MNQAIQLIDFLKKKHWSIRCVESCTAGAVTAAIGAISGASLVLDRSWVTYTNQAKHEEVGVSLDILNQYGAVSEQVVLAMAEGAVQGCEPNTLSLAISGVAGPSGGTKDKPVGTVWIACKIPNQPAFAQCFHFEGDRAQVRTQATKHALTMPLQG